MRITVARGIPVGAMTKPIDDLSELERWRAYARLCEYADREAEAERRFWAAHPLPPERAVAGRPDEPTARRRERPPVRRTA
jgi:hypothetical protein